MGVVGRRLMTLAALLAAVGAGYAYMRRDATLALVAQTDADKKAQLFVCPRLDRVVEITLSSADGNITLARRAKIAPALPAVPAADGAAPDASAATRTPATGAKASAKAAEGDVAETAPPAKAGTQADAQTDAQQIQRGEQAGAWVLTAPLTATADQETVGALLQATCALRQQGQALAADGNAAKGVHLAAFGLAPAQASLQLRFLDGSTQTVAFGHKSGFDGSLYARKGNAATICLVDGGFTFQLQRDAFSLREKRLLDFVADDVVRLQVRGTAAKGAKPATPYTLERNADGSGFVLQTKAQAHPADKLAAQTLMASLAHARAKRFVAEKASPEVLTRFGLAHPALEVTLTMADGSAHNLRLGRLQLGEGSHDFAQGDDVLGPVAELPSNWLLDKLTAAATELRDMHVLQLDAAAVAQITVQTNPTHGGKVLRLYRQGPDDVPLAQRPFVLDDPNHAQADGAARIEASKAAATLARLAELRADAFVDGDGDGNSSAEVLHKAQLAPPQRQITFADAKGTKLATLQVGHDDGHHVAVLGNRTKQVAYVFANALQGIDAEPTSWLEVPTTAPPSASAP